MNIHNMLATLDPLDFQELNSQELNGNTANSPPPILTMRVPKVTKPRLRCLQPGCKRTFPRAYELERHQSSVHDLVVAICCSVYGCNRVAKPFPRVDKFYEHMRKHENANQFLCIFDDCRAGPLSRAELLSHLINLHALGDCKQPNQAAALGVLRVRATQLSNGTIVVEDSRNCPLSFLGCTFQHDQNRTTGHRAIVDDHLRTHELVDRSRGYEAMITVKKYWCHSGLATCIICQKPVSTPKDRIQVLFYHLLYSHSKEERAAHAIGLAEMLRPLLLEKVHWEDVSPQWGKLFGMTIKVELEEAGALPKAIASLGHATCPVMYGHLGSSG